MKKEVEYSIKKLETAFQRLEEGINSVKDDLDKDGVIQRFEFTFELLWKTIKIYFEDKGILCKSPKDCLQQAFKYGLITNELVYLNMLNDRNKTSHLYDQSASEEIYTNIKSRYLEAINSLLAKIKTD